MAQRQKQARPAHHANDTASSFANPWPSAEPRTWMDVLQTPFPFSLYPAKIHNHQHARSIKVVAPDWGEASLARQQLSKEKSLIGTWLGHASALVELPNLADQSTKSSLYLLFDPIFSTRASPTQTSGPARFKPAPCQVADLPGCDAVFVSHNHYDHLDLASVQGLLKKFPRAKYFVPLGIKSWLLAVGIPEHLTHELDWWDECRFSPGDFELNSTKTKADNITIKVTCVPAQHNSARSPIDQGRTLWCGWVTERFIDNSRASASSTAERCGAIFHAGDTGYRKASNSTDVCPAFKEISAKFGSFDLSFIPIWRGGTLGFISSYGVRLLHHYVPAAHHASPADAINIHLDVRSRNTIGVHFGTFVGSENETHEAAIEFAEACDERSVDPLMSPSENKHGRAGLLDIGASLAVDIL